MDIHNDQFVMLPEAARQLGLSVGSLRCRVRRGDLTPYQHLLDRRIYLFRRDDLEQYRQPVKVDRNRGDRPSAGR